MAFEEGRRGRLRRLADRLIERPPGLWRLMAPKGEFRYPSADGRKRIFLTFDDGPDPEITPWVLDELDRDGAKATFFMVGDNASRHPELVEMVRERGHAVGNHTFHHLAGMRVGTRRYLRDVALADKLLQTPLIRPPHGWMRPSLARALARRYRIVMYDLVTRDYSWRMRPEDVVENVRRYTRDGSIIVFHDSHKAWPRLREALPAALDWLRREGYIMDSIG